MWRARGEHLYKSLATGLIAHQDGFELFTETEAEFLLDNDMSR